MSSALLYTGSQGPRELTPRFQKSDGVWSTTRRFRGLKEELLSVAESIGDRSASLSQEDEFWWLLESQSPGKIEDPNSPPTSLEDQIVILWSLESAMIGKSIWDLPRIKKQFFNLWGKGGITDEEREGIAKFRADFMALARGESVSFQASPGSAAGDDASPTSIKITLTDVLRVIVAAGGDRQEFVGLFEALASGVEQYQIDTLVLTKRLVAPLGARLPGVFTNRNRAISRSTFLATESLPVALMDDLPEGFYFKGSSTITQSDKTRVEMVQMWTYTEEYDRFIFGSPL